MAIAIAAGIGAAGSLLSGVIGSGASKKAASTQANANNYSAQMVYQMYQQTAERLKPWVDTGAAANKQLGSFLGLPGSDKTATGGFAPGAAMQPFNPTMQQLEQTPGYQFIKEQGLNATTNAGTAMGLGGSTLKGIDSFSTGLASTTWQQQFDNYWKQIGNVYNMLSGQSVTGENAAAQTGQQGMTAANTAGNFNSAAGTNIASGIIGSGSAMTGAINSASSLPLQLAMFKQMNPATGGTTIPGTNMNANQLNSWFDNAVNSNTSTGYTA